MAKTQPTVPFDPESCFSPDIVQRLRSLRRDLHRRPELAFEEHETAKRLEAELERLQPVSIERVAGTGIVARIRGRDPAAPVVAVRGDIDALPIGEDTGLAFASENPGVMHACGHDVHASWAVGAAYHLTGEPASGDVIVVLQPAEEIGRGATAILDSGALDDVRAIFGAHVDRRFPVGSVVADDGPLAAAADMFEIVLRGSGSHGARPHESRDPVVAAGTVISALQSIVSRRLNPATPGVVSIGTIHGGTACNIIPDTVALTGTIRSVDPESRKLLHEEVALVARHVGNAHGVDAEVRVELGTPPIVNPPDTAQWARDAVARVLSPDAIVPLGFSNMGGEDFAFYMERMPGCFLRIGAREHNGEVIPAHSPRFYAGEDCLFIGAAVLAETARVASRVLATGRVPRVEEGETV